MNKYKALSPINHNDKAYSVGDTVELDDDIAAPLLKIAAIEAAPAEGAAAISTAKKK